MHAAHEDHIRTNSAFPVCTSWGLKFSYLPLALKVRKGTERTQEIMAKISQESAGRVKAIHTEKHTLSREQDRSCRASNSPKKHFRNAQKNNLPTRSMASCKDFNNSRDLQPSIVTYSARCHHEVSRKDAQQTESAGEKKKLHSLFS